MNASNRPVVVLAIGVLSGAGLVELGSLLGSAPPAPPIVMVLKTAPAPEPMPLFFASPPPSEPAPQAVVKQAVVKQAVVKQAVVKPAVAKQAVAKTARGVKARRTALSALPDGVVAGLRRSGGSATGAVARELVAGARALERGTAYTAWAHFTRALTLDRDNRDALMGVALCHYELEQKGAADRALTRLLTLDPTHPEASILRGFIAQLAGDQGSAIEWYERALPRLEDDAVAEELRAVIAWLRPQLSYAPSATARFELTR